MVADVEQADRAVSVTLSVPHEEGRRGFRIFLSYSWDDLERRRRIVDELTNDGHHVRVDSFDVAMGDDLSDVLIKRLSSSDILLVHFTTAAASSKHVNEELIRAHSLFVRIFALVESSAQEALPSFLRNRLYRLYSSRESPEGSALASFSSQLLLMRQDLGQELKHLDLYEAKHRSREQLSLLARIAKSNQDAPLLRRAKQEVARRVIALATDEIRCLSTDQYRASVQPGTHFLSRAIPIFTHAKNVYAVSIDRISKFWIEAPRLQLTDQYLKAQPDNTRRLFVFSSPEEAHNYGPVLDEHFAQYGTSGSVLLCSSETYRSILAKQRVQRKEVADLEIDFALLEYPDGQGASMLEAVLDGGEYSVGRLQITSELQGFPEFFRTLDILQPGELWHNSGVRSSESSPPGFSSGIMRWERGAHTRRPSWSEKLKALFESRPPDWMHMVFFSREAVADEFVKQRLLAYLRELRALLDRICTATNDSIRLKEFWFGEAMPDFMPTDANARAPFHHESREFPYVLLMRFDDQGSLDGWYRHSDHREMRSRIYELFGEEVKALLEKLRVMTENGHWRNSTADLTTLIETHDALEHSVRRFIARRDYMETETIDDIVVRQPI